MRKKLIFKLSNFLGTTEISIASWSQLSLQSGERKTYWHCSKYICPKTIPTLKCAIYYIRAEIVVNFILGDNMLWSFFITRMILSIIFKWPVRVIEGEIVEVVTALWYIHITIVYGCMFWLKQPGLLAIHLNDDFCIHLVFSVRVSIESTTIRYSTTISMNMTLFTNTLCGMDYNLTDLLLNGRTRTVTYLNTKTKTKKINW